MLPALAFLSCLAKVLAVMPSTKPIAKKKRRYETRARARAFKGIPVREARASIHVQPNQDDISRATKESPTNCAYARCLRRVFDAPNVFVFKSVVYVETLDEKGKKIMERYMVKKYAREYIIRFDGGEKVEPGGFVFHKPARSKTLVYKQQNYRYRSPHSRTGKVAPRQKQFSLRSGKGLVHLLGNEDQIRSRQGA